MTVHRCHHGHCHCQVAAPENYCSEHCREASEDGAAAEAFSMGVCRCGHGECDVAEAAAQARRRDAHPALGSEAPLPD